MFKTLTELASPSSTNNAIITYSTSSPTGMEPDTSSLHVHPPQPPCNPCVKYITDVVPETLNRALQKFVHEKADEFASIGGCCDTLYFGEFGYKYSGGRHDAKEMPVPVLDLLNTIRTHCS